MADILPDYVTEENLRGIALSPEDVAATHPWAAEPSALDGTRCWAEAGIATRLVILGGDR